MENRILRNAWVRKDADGHYFLLFKTNDGQQAMLNLSVLNPSIDRQIKDEMNPARKESLTKRIIDAWIAEQDGVEEDPEFPDVIDG